MSDEDEDEDNVLDGEDDDDASDGEDDTEDEREMLKTTPSRSRSSLPRRSKSAKKSYHQDDDSDEDSSTNVGEDDMVDGEYDIDAEREALEATPSKSRPRSKSVAKPQHQVGEDGDEGEDTSLLKASKSAETAHGDRQAHQDDENSDDGENSNLPKVAMSTQMAHEDEQVDFFAAKTSEGADKSTPNQQMTEDNVIPIFTGPVDWSSWLTAPLMTYPRDTWSGLVLALLWIWQFIVVPFKLMTIALLIWEVQGEDRSVNA